MSRPLCRYGKLPNAVSFVVKLLKQFQKSITWLKTTCTVCGTTYPIDVYNLLWDHWWERSTKIHQRVDKFRILNFWQLNICDQNCISLSSFATIPEIHKLVHEAQHFGHHLCMTYAISLALLQMYCVAAAAMSTEFARAGGLTTFARKYPKRLGLLVFQEPELDMYNQAN